MEIKRRSGFKNVSQDHLWYDTWVMQVEELNHKIYSRLEVETSLGKTSVWGWNTELTDTDTLVIFPGARTSSLFWDLDNNLNNLGIPLRIFMVETNGLPNLSDGNTPDIKSNDYGVWAEEVFYQLGIDRAYVAGASFGGLICMKLAIYAPYKVKSAFLLNPGCLQSFSLSFKNLYYNLLPIVRPNQETITKFLDNAIFCKPHHQLSAEAEWLLKEYELFALTRFKDRTQKPYYMNSELKEVWVDTYLILGDKDLLFPYQRSLRNAKDKLPRLKETHVLPDVGHGIETYAQAIELIGETIRTCAHKEHYYEAVL